MRINHNVTAMNTANNLSNVNYAQAKTLEKLGSGYRINRAADDAAGIAISEKMRGEIAVLGQRKSNEQDKLSFSNAQDGALAEISTILTNLQQLVTQSGASDVSGSIMMNTTATANIGAVMLALNNAISSFKTSTMNGIALTSPGQGMNVVLGTVTQLTSASNLAAIQTAVNVLNTQRATIGSRANQAESQIRQYATQVENLTEAESRIRDTDMAAAMVEFSKNNILSNAATAMLAQANQTPQNVLQLLR